MNNAKYEKDFRLLTDTVVSVLADGRFPINDADKMNKYLNDTERDRVLAVIEYPTVDIELEAYSRNGADAWTAFKGDDEIMLTYYVCTKGKTMWNAIEWVSDDFVPREVNVDFSAGDWEEQLERDMVDALADYVETHGYSYTELNFNDYD